MSKILGFQGPCWSSQITEKWMSRALQSQFPMELCVWILSSGRWRVKNQRMSHTHKNKYFFCVGLKVWVCYTKELTQSQTHTCQMEIYRFLWLILSVGKYSQGVSSFTQIYAKLTGKYSYTTQLHAQNCQAS